MKKYRILPLPAAKKCVTHCISRFSTRADASKITRSSRLACLHLSITINPACCFCLRFALSLLLANKASRPFRLFFACLTITFASSNSLSFKTAVP